MMGTRANIFNESFLNETDQDANSVLIELDKGLRSAKTGEQCEAIIRFPKLFEKYPFPILINSSFLKLAEFFRIGSNLSRLWVLRVCQQSEKHLEKIVNVDEFVKRIFMVIHSNDPVARALTLRTLGAVACVIPEKQQVHHAIRNALDSHDTVEVEAAIYASVQFAAQSNRTENIPPPICFIEHLNMNLEYLIHSALHNKAPLKDFKIYLRCGIQLSKINQEFGENFAETLAELLVEDSEYSVPHLKLICEALGAICSSFSTSYQIAQNQTDEIHHPLKAILIPILTKLESYNEASTLDRNDTCVIELLVSISLQAMLGSLMNERVMQIYNNLLKFLNYWTQYRIARSASRYGQHFLAALIYQKLCKHVSLEKLHFYLTAMFQISKAECMLNYDAEYEQLVLDFPGNLQPDNSKSSLLDRLEKAINLYCMAQSTLKATSSPQHPMNFQLEVINLRCQFLQVLHGIVVSRNTLCITPPSAISNTLAQNLRDPLQKFGHVTNQLRKNVKILKSCEEAYCKLYKSSFDADPCTLEYLNIIQHLCSIMQTSIETISFTTPTDSANHPPNCSYPETRYLLFICQTVSKQMQTFPNEISSTKSITNKHMDMLLRQIEIVIKSAHCMPRFFFQVLQNTSVKLALTPQPRIAGEPILVPPNSNLVVKVEGVIQHYGKKPSLFRSIESVQITLSTQYVTARMNDIKINTENTVLTQIVKPHRDFLSGNFLLSLNNAVQAYPGASVSSGGQWQVTLETCVIDHDGIVWTAGPKSVLHVRIPEDNHKQSMNVQSSARRF
ncbi:integrator complex subunit 7 isoform X3 [Toxorhynchites rutilus septentrionalis]|uniref:integrator complex subunit 7 isoform X3 n=1 Tax=Toxorhynchites rutilus septentrionalis TaxID=329112 RepID=UPI002478E84F|nr:integrator complex subunit 7 isoform X3 [Toxorhynchites rutilus septentrionalis]